MLENNQEISAEWMRLIKLGKALNYGEARVVFKDGKPVRVECAIKQIVLDNDDAFEEQFKIIPLN